MSDEQTPRPGLRKPCPLCAKRDERAERRGDQEHRETQDGRPARSLADPPLLAARPTPGAPGREPRQTSARMG